MFKKAFITTMWFLLLLLFWHRAPVLAQQGHSPFQVRVTGACPAGSSINAINADGSVVCEVDAVGVTAVTASAPLVATGTTTPNISLPNVIIDTGTNGTT